MMVILRCQMFNIKCCVGIFHFSLVHVQAVALKQPHQMRSQPPKNRTLKNTYNIIGIVKIVYFVNFTKVNERLNVELTVCIDNSFSPTL